MVAVVGVVAAGPAAVAQQGLPGLHRQAPPVDRVGRPDLRALLVRRPVLHPLAVRALPLGSMPLHLRTERPAAEPLA